MKQTKAPGAQKPLPARALEPLAEQATDDEQLPPKRMKTTLVSVRMDESTLKRLEPLAKAQGVGVSTLIRMWTLKRLSQEVPETADPWV
jgi:hypothetical protein